MKDMKLTYIMDYYKSVTKKIETLENISDYLRLETALDSELTIRDIINKLQEETKVLKDKAISIENIMIEIQIKS